ncbi:MAG: DUF1566 domain-containing protein [Candidatus Scalindua sp.]|nr:DUF1566 domain-containing protein [Candidatus Scalindua sp.]
MKKYIFVLALIISFVLLSFSLVSIAEEQDEGTVLVSPTGHEISGNQWLFIIGIDSYTNFPHLNTSVNDAKAVKEVLLRRYHFDEYHTIELYDEDATRRNILGKLRYLTRRVGPDDSVTIFYSGHGVLDSAKREGSWMPVEGATEDRSSWISNKEIYNYLKIDANKAKHILLIVDSCFSGDSLRSHRGKITRATDEYIKLAYEQGSRQVITSGEIKPVVEREQNENSIFIRFLIKKLNENKKPFFVSSELFKEIRTGLDENSYKVPGFGTLNDGGEQKGGELVLLLNGEELVRLNKIKWQERIDRKYLRSSYMDLSVTQAQSMPYVEIREDQDWGFYGHSTIRHQYEVRSIVYEEVVIDHATGLMWHQNGSERFKDKEKISEWVDNLNLKGYAGFKDWRLPTAEEAASLLESAQTFGGMYVHTVFSKKQPWIWTGDSYGIDAAWVMSACYGSVFWNKFDEYFSVRPVRSMK